MRRKSGQSLQASDCHPQSIDKLFDLGCRIAGTEAYSHSSTSDFRGHTHGAQDM
jgi:hypothetical protein